MPNPRKQFTEWLAKYDPTAVEQLVRDLDTCSASAFEEVRALVSNLASTADVKEALTAASAEVEKRPQKEPTKEAAALAEAASAVKRE